MNLEDILLLKVSFQKDTWSSISDEKTLNEILYDIKGEKYNKIIEDLRGLLKMGDFERYSIHKKSLPCVTFCGTFNSHRRREFIKEYNYLLVIDIDKLESEELNRIKNVLNSDKYVFAFWESPSGNGLKGLVSVSYDFNLSQSNLDLSHKNAFNIISTYFINNYNIVLDESGSDTTRLCYLTSDANLVLKKELVSFLIKEQGEIKYNHTNKNSNLIFEKKSINKDLLYNTRNKNDPAARKTIQSIIKYLKKRNLSITNSYEDWFKVAYGISNTFSYDLGEKYFLMLSELDGLKYKKIECINLLNYCYRNNLGQIRFNTIIFFANNKGYLSKLQRSEVSKTTSS